MPDYKKLCAELLGSAGELDNLIEGIRLGNYMPDSLTLQPMRAALARARAELAEPEPEGPTDEEVDAWADQQGFIRGHGDHPCGFWIDDGDAGALVRAAIARWGNRQVLLDNLPADDEVAELMEWLNKAAKHAASVGWDYDSCKLARSASLIERLSHPQPVPVSECLPEPEPVAWMYQGEPSFDGTDWQKTWEVTTDKRLAEFKATPDQPIPLFSIQPQRQ